MIPIHHDNTRLYACLTTQPGGLGSVLATCNAVVVEARLFTSGEIAAYLAERVATANRLEAELAACRKRCEGLAERVAEQSELLSRRAERGPAS